MKTITVAAGVLALIAICFISLHSFSEQKKHINVNSITGQWLIDKDSSHVVDSAKAPLLSKLVLKDSLPAAIEFGDDSACRLVNKTTSRAVSNKYYFDPSQQKLFVKDDSVFISFNVTHISDSTMKIGDDSDYYTLKKQP